MQRSKQLQHNVTTERNNIRIKYTSLRFTRCCPRQVSDECGGIETEGGLGRETERSYCQDNNNNNNNNNSSSTKCIRTVRVISSISSFTTGSAWLLNHSDTTANTARRSGSLLAASAFP